MATITHSESPPSPKPKLVQVACARSLTVKVYPLSPFPPPPPAPPPPGVPVPPLAASISGKPQHMKRYCQGRVMGPALHTRPDAIWMQSWSGDWQSFATPARILTGLVHVQPWEVADAITKLSHGWDDRYSSRGLFLWRRRKFTTSIQPDDETPCLMVLSSLQYCMAALSRVPTALGGASQG